MTDCIVNYWLLYGGLAAATTFQVLIVGRLGGVVDVGRRRMVGFLLAALLLALTQLFERTSPGFGIGVLGSLLESYYLRVYALVILVDAVVVAVRRRFLVLAFELIALATVGAGWGIVSGSILPKGPRNLEVHLVQDYEGLVRIREDPKRAHVESVDDDAVVSADATGIAWVDDVERLRCALESGVWLYYPDGRRLQVGRLGITAGSHEASVVVSRNDFTAGGNPSFGRAP